MDAFPRFSLCHLPTPLQPAPRLGAWLGGIELWIKRDDLTGLALGGNKTRKLEYLVGAARAAGCDTLITAGAAQSNHCRQTAAAAAAAGLRCHLALGGAAPAQAQGNLLLDHLLGAHLHWCGAHRKGEDLPALAKRLQGEGLRPYVVPYGGSNVTGALGYARAAHELVEQCDSLDLVPHRVVLASSSGGTQAGLVAGFSHAGREVRVTGVRVDKTDATPTHSESLELLARSTAAALSGHEAADLRLEIELVDDALHAAYGEVTAAEREAIAVAGRLEGLLLDPVYTGRAFAGLTRMVREGRIAQGETVVFWHTGGHPALFAHAHDLVLA